MFLVPDIQNMVCVFLLFIHYITIYIFRMLFNLNIQTEAVSDNIERTKEADHILNKSKTTFKLFSIVLFCV